MSGFNASTPQLRVAKQWVDAYVSLDTKNVAAVTSKSYQYQALPDVIGIPKETKEKHIERFKGVMSAMTKAEVICHEVIEAPGKVVIHATRVLSAAPGGMFTYNVLTILTLVEEDGELKVLHCKDFTDTQKRGAFIAGAIKAAAERVAA